MGNRYKEVFLTYLRRAFSSWRAMVWAALFIWSIFSDGGGRPGHIGPGSVFSGVAYGGSLLWFHLRSQLVGPNRRLTPGYLRPTITVFIAMGLLVMAFPTVILAMRHGFCDGVFFALAVFEFGLIGCALAAEKWLVTAACLLVILFLSRHFGHYIDLPRDGVGYFAIGQAVFGLAAISWSLFRMAAGPIRDGEFATSFGGSANLEATARSTGRFLGSLLGPSRSVGPVGTPIPAAKIYYGHPMALGGATRDHLRRWRHMRVLEINLVPAIFLLCFAVSLIVGKLANSASEVTADFSAVVPFAAFWPAAVVSGRWRQAWPCVRADSLRPENRANFALGVFLAIGEQVLLAWLAFAVAALAAYAVAGLGLSGVGRLASELLATLMIQPLVYALLCWQLPFGTSAWMFSIILLTFAVLGLGATTEFWGAWLTVGVAAVCMLIGLILLPFVYRRWMDLEMG